MPRALRGSLQYLTRGGGALQPGSLQPGTSWLFVCFAAAADDSLSEDDKRILIHWLYRQRELRPETPSLKPQALNPKS